MENNIVILLVKLYILETRYLNHELIETDKVSEINNDLFLAFYAVMLD